MSVAMPLYVPEFDTERATDARPEFDSPAVVRGPRLRAVPAAEPVPHAVPVRRPSRPATAPTRDRASVSVLHAPDVDRAPVRLTRRGVVVLAALLAAVGAALVWVAALSAPADSAPATGAGGPAVVTVGSGDTLWSIASRVAPDVDPRAEVDHLRALNQLDSVALQPGQQLRVR